MSATFLMTLIGLIATAQPTSKTATSAKDAPIIAEMNDAIEKVKAIVNQPVAAYKRTAGMRVSLWPDGWFHEGATKPDFDNADVRTTQEFPYKDNPYHRSPQHPDVVFLGSQMEFNSQTKYFYADYTLPKKKLTEAEMVEINRLYRIIGQCEKKLNANNPKPKSELESGTETKGEPARMVNRKTGTIAILGILAFYVLVRMFRSS